MSATPTTVGEAHWSLSGNVCGEVCETHTGVVVLIGDRAYKAKKPVVTDFLDFSTLDGRERACAREVVLNSRLARDSYLGVGHFSDPLGGPCEPVVVMRRYADSCRLATLVRTGEPVEDHLVAVADKLARFHATAARGPAIDAHSTVDAVAARWQQNLAELRGYLEVGISADALHEVQRLATRFISGRSALFAQRITDRCVVDGHADLLADDIFCLSDGPALLDCLEFDDHLRFVDGIDDAAFLAMDLEFLGRADLGDLFLDHYRRFSGDAAPRALRDFYVGYRAVVRAKVDCVRFGQGHRAAADDAARHLAIALDHLRAGTVRLVVIGGGPGTGKTTLAHALAEQLDAQVISTDDVRRQLWESGTITGAPGTLDVGLYSSDNVASVYDTVLRRAHRYLGGGQSVVLDGTWRDSRQRQRAHDLAAETASPISELSCSTVIGEAAERIRHRTSTTSDATPEIAAALAEHEVPWQGAYVIDTSRPIADSLAEAQEICRLTV